MFTASGGPERVGQEGRLVGWLQAHTGRRSGLSRRRGRAAHRLLPPSWNDGEEARLLTGGPMMRNVVRTAIHTTNVTERGRLERE